MKKLFLGIFLLFSVQIFAKPTVSVSIAPQKYIISQIAQDLVDVNVVVGKNDDPHSFEPRPSTILALSKSDIYFSIGVEFEDIWLLRMQKQNPKMKIVKSQNGIDFIENTHEHHEEHHHHDDDEHHHEHHHGKYDTHIWLDPINMKKIAKNTADALILAYPQNEKIFSKNLSKLLNKLDLLDEYINEKLKQFKDHSFIVYHPSWTYFANRYHLNQIAIEIDAKEPKANDLQKLIKKSLEKNIKMIFVAPQFSQKSANTLAQKTGAKVLQIDPLDENYESFMKKMTDELANSFKTQN